MLRVLLTDFTELPEVVALPVLSERLADILPGVSSLRVKKESTAAELLLRYALGYGFQDAPLPLATAPKGKPYLTDGSVHFSFSHSGCCALCAVSDREIGADLQELTTYRPGVARRFFTAGEAESLAGAENPNEAFTRLWCLKESFVKWNGLGLSLGLDTFEVSRTETGPVIAGQPCRLFFTRQRDRFIAVCADESLAEHEMPAVETIPVNKLYLF